MTDPFIEQYLQEAVEILQKLDRAVLHDLIGALDAVRERGGRLFVLGSGGGAGNAAHAVCDFRKILGFEAYSPSDNVSELTARVNDDGWANAYRDWLATSRLSARDGVLVFSVGGGSVTPPVSENLVRALEYARGVGATTCGVVGRDGGFTRQVADVCVVVAVPAPERVTAHTEGLQAVIWHLIVSDPRLRPRTPTWEALSGSAERT